MDSIVAQIQNISSTASEATRREMMVVLRDLAYSLENADDTIHRVGYLHLQTATIRTGFNLKLFETLSEANGSQDVKGLAQITDTPVDFLSRFMRYLASTGAVKETGKDTYAANTVTRNLAEKVTLAGVSHCFETIGPQYQALPAFLKKHSYEAPTDPLHTVFQDAWATELGAFSWYSTQPEKLQFFNDYMAFRREPALSWLSVYPVEEETKNWDPSLPVFVNMGGGVGHQCAQFKAKYPDIPGRVILQDLPHSIENALPTQGVENMVHNFFDPQPIKGAKFYFLRGVLHNHPDHKIRLLLRNIKSAMTADSIILLDEMILPETGVSSYAAAMDMTMMAACASQERTEAQWRALLSSVDLEIAKSSLYNPSSYEGVMAAKAV
ncbi:hypothetical protein EAE96_003874 [Botrytis aclada]|nr:hypothetical protein EAE96_003874 [Botrytis aclada]